MKLSDRDWQLAIFMPALAVVIGYLMLFATAPEQQIKQLRAQIMKARQSSPRPSELADCERRAASVGEERAAVEAESGKTQAKLEALRKPANGHAAERVAALFPRHRLALLEQVSLPGPPKEAAPALQRMFAAFDPALRADAPAFWRLRFAGAYGDVVAVLDELAAADYWVIPVNLSMSDGSQPGCKTWTLVLWM